MPIKGPGKEMQRRMAALAAVACTIGFSAVVVRSAVDANVSVRLL